MAQVEAHVIPVDDAVGHEPNENCVCGPTPKLAKTRRGGDGWLMVHHSLDQREKKEAADGVQP